MRTIAIVALLVILATTVVGCGRQLVNPGTPVVVASSSAGVNRYIDSDAGVVCWVFYGFYMGGISCLPIGQTKLPQ